VLEKDLEQQTENKYSGRHLLIVDDDSSMRLLLAELRLLYLRRDDAGDDRP
jgi:hypothetical protein